MTAPVFIVSPDALESIGGAGAARSGDVLTLTGPEARHAVTVRRLRTGERADLVDGEGLRLMCEVEAVEAVNGGAAGAGRGSRLVVRVIERVVEPAAPLRLTLVQALAKGGRDEQAVETATEVGVAGSAVRVGVEGREGHQGARAVAGDGPGGRQAGPSRPGAAGGGGAYDAGAGRVDVGGRRVRGSGAGAPRGGDDAHRRGGTAGAG